MKTFYNLAFYYISLFATYWRQRFLLTKKKEQEDKWQKSYLSIILEGGSVLSQSFQVMDNNKKVFHNKGKSIKEMYAKYKKICIVEVIVYFSASIRRISSTHFNPKLCEFQTSEENIINFVNY